MGFNHQNPTPELQPDAGLFANPHHFGISNYMPSRLAIDTTPQTKESVTEFFPFGVDKDTKHALVRIPNEVGGDELYYVQTSAKKVEYGKVPARFNTKNTPQVIEGIQNQQRERINAGIKSKDK